MHESVVLSPNTSGYVQVREGVPPNLSRAVDSSCPLQSDVFTTEVPSGSGVLLKGATLNFNFFGLTRAHVIGLTYSR